jgi:hypothetical protein
MHTPAPPHFPIVPSRRSVVASILSLAAAGRFASAQDAQKPNWREVLHTAETYVAHSLLRDGKYRLGSAAEELRDLHRPPTCRERDKMRCALPYRT